MAARSKKQELDSEAMQPAAPADEQRRKLFVQFANYVQTKNRLVNNLHKNLAETGYASETLRAFAAGYQKLKERFMDILEDEADPYYVVLSRSDARTEFAEQVRDRCGALADKFQEYAEGEKYKWTDVRTLLKKLSIALKNLRSATLAAANEMSDLDF